MTKEELVHEMILIGSTARPALMYRIAKQRMRHKHRRQHG